MLSWCVLSCKDLNFDDSFSERIVLTITFALYITFVEGGDGRIIELCQDINYNQKQLFHAVKPFPFYTQHR